jgi:hypothetical protein
MRWGENAEKRGEVSPRMHMTAVDNISFAATKEPSKAK